MIAQKRVDQKVRGEHLCKAAGSRARCGDRGEAVTNKIAQARRNAAALKASGTTDPNAALTAAGQMTAGIRVFFVLN